MTTFIRIVSGGPPLPADAHPQIELLAHDPNKRGGSPPPRLDAKTNTGLGSAVTLFDDVNPTGAALAYFVPPFLNNIYLLKVVIQIPGTRLWIKITNNGTDDPDDEELNYRFVWVVADSDADSQQPWLHITYPEPDFVAGPANLKFNLSVSQGGTVVGKQLMVGNLGTGPVTLVNVTPSMGGTPFSISGLPQTINANTGSRAVVNFNVPTQVGDIPPAVFTFVTSNRPDAGPFGLGHNNQIIASAHISSNVWVARAAMLTPRMSSAAAGARNGRVYVIGGQPRRPEGTSEFPANLVESYDPTTNTWASHRPMPTERTDLGLVAASSGKLYAIGGSDLRNELPNVEEYDPATDTWVIKAPMPIPRRSFGLAAASNGRIYAAGGFTSEPGTSASMDEYDPVANAWSHKAPMQIPRWNFNLAASINGRLYAVGGFTSNSVTTGTTEEYNPATNSWTLKAPLQFPRSGAAVVAFPNGRLYAVGGMDGERVDRWSFVEEYDPARDTWTLKAPMPSGRTSPAAAVASSGKLYVLGGWTGARISDANEECAP
jgi:N-acetylneuraminic acid mutarotase